MLGGDKDNYSYGSQIYEAYTLRPYDFGTFIGQGSKQHFFRLNIQFNYQIMEKGAINGFIEFALRYDLKSQGNSSQDSCREKAVRFREHIVGERIPRG